MFSQKENILNGLKQFTYNVLNLSNYFWILLFLSATLFTNTSVKANEEPIVKFLAFDIKDDSIIHNVQSGTNLLLPFTNTQSTDPNMMVEFYLSDFKGEHGDIISIKPLIIEKPDLKPIDQRLSFLFDKPVLTLKLEIPELPTTDKYIAILSINQNNKVFQELPVIITRAKVQQPAKLTIDHKSINVYCTKSWLPWKKDSTKFTLLVRNDNPEWHAKGIFLRLVDITSPKGSNFDPNNITFTWNGKQTESLWHSPILTDPNSTSYSIAPNQQAEISGNLINLATGEYSLKIGVDGINVELDTGQQITLKVNVRHSWIWAAGILIFAIFVSLITTKGFDAQRNRIKYLQRISQLKQPLLRNEPQTLPVVSVRSILSQAEKLNKHWYSALSGTDVLNERLDKCDKMVEVLREVHKIRLKLENWNQPTMIKYRARQHFSGITNNLDPKSADEKTITEIKGKLVEFDNNWFDKNKLKNLYWSKIIERVNYILAEVKPDFFSDQNLQNIVEDLRNKIIQYQTTIMEPEDAATTIDQCYAMLKIFWECRHDNRILEQLTTLFDNNKSPSADDFFEIANDFVWKKIKNACDPEIDGIEFILPTKSKTSPKTAYELIQFEVKTKDRKLGDNYLFRSGLKYKWELNLETTNIFGKTKVETLAAPVTDEPRVIQYIPRTGTLYVSVTLCYKNDCSAKLNNMILLINKSQDFALRGAITFVGFTSVLIAGLFALISGMSTYYIGKYNFGTFSDYITLFIWGAGIDQTKNFIQNLSIIRDTKANNPPS